MTSRDGYSDETEETNDPDTTPDEEREGNETDSTAGGPSDAGEGELEEALELLRQGRADEITEEGRAELLAQLDAGGDTDGGDESDGGAEEIEGDADSSLEARLATVEEELAELREQLDGDGGGGPDDERVAALEAEVDNLRSQIESVGDGFDGATELLERVDEHAETLEALQSAFEEHQSAFESHREQAEREREQIRKYALQDFALEVIRVKDSIENTVEFVDLDGEAQEQLELVLDQFEQALERSNVERIDTDGTFDLDRHKIMGETHSEEHEPDEIVRTEKEGYRLHDRIIRRAKVVIAAAD